MCIPMDSKHGSNDLPRYWITLDKKVIWGYPKQFVTKDGTVKNLSGSGTETNYNRLTVTYPYITDIRDISRLIREYIDTPKDEIFSKAFENDHWGSDKHFTCGRSADW